MDAKREGSVSLKLALYCPAHSVPVHCYVIVIQSVTPAECLQALGEQVRSVPKDLTPVPVAPLEAMRATNT